MSKVFYITKRHYDIITKQAADNFPQEAGGFLGGKDFTLSAIMPIPNQHLENRTDTFMCTQADIQRAHEFFNKHGLQYYGLYHTHPNGAPEPSQQDISTGHKYHFIIAVFGKDPSKTIMRAFEVKSRIAHPIPMQILLQDGNVKDLKNPQKNLSPSPQDPLYKEAEHLGDLMDGIRNYSPKYKKENPIKKDGSDFSTLA